MVLPPRDRDRVEIRYIVDAPESFARLGIFDVTGHLVWSLHESVQGQGEHTVVWNGRDARGALVARGVYLVRLEAAGTHLAKKLVLLGDQYPSASSARRAARSSPRAHEIFSARLVRRLQQRFES